jgi:hypothetical protein
MARRAGDDGVSFIAFPLFNYLGGAGKRIFPHRLN